MENRKPKQETFRKVVKWLLLLLLAAAFGSGVGLCIKHPIDSNATPRYAEAQDYSDVSEAASVAIPCYTNLVFKAGQKTQQVSFYNPEENTYYFKLSLILEDGTVIWTSDLLEPAMELTEITLNQPLDKGIYSNVTMRCDCYSLKNQSQVNGGQSILTVEVK